MIPVAEVVAKTVEYPKLAVDVVEHIHVSPYKRSWLAEKYGIPKRLVTLIKRAASREIAMKHYGH